MTEDTIEQREKARSELDTKDMFSNCCQKAILKYPKDSANNERGFTYFKCSNCHYDTTPISREDAIVEIENQIKKDEENIVKLKAQMYSIRDGAEPSYEDF